MRLVTLSAKGGLVTGRIFLGLVGGLHGQGINSVLDTTDRVLAQEEVPRCII